MKTKVISLPFSSELTLEHIVLAAILRRKYFLSPQGLQLMNPLLQRTLTGNLYGLCSEKNYLSNKLEPLVHQFQYGRDISSGLVEKCVKSLDDSKVFFDDILSAFINIFNKKKVMNSSRIRTSIVP